MTDIVERLNVIAGLKRGDPLIDADRPASEGWHAIITVLCTDAIAEIMRLRTTVEQLRAVAGVISTDGQSFADIRRDIGK